MVRADEGPAIAHCDVVGQRRGVQPGEPPIPGRFARLADMIGDALRLADAELGADGGSRLAQAMSTADHKGDFTVMWRGAAERTAFAAIVDRALAAAGEDEVLHQLR